MMQNVKYSATHSDKETALYWAQRYIDSAQKSYDSSMRRYLDSGKGSRSNLAHDAAMRLEIVKTLKRLKNKLAFEFDDRQR